MVSHEVVDVLQMDLENKVLFSEKHVCQINEMNSVTSIKFHLPVNWATL